MMQQWRRRAATIWFMHWCVPLRKLSGMSLEIGVAALPAPSVTAAS
jgi:hypothetical protein